MQAELSDEALHRRTHLLVLAHDVPVVVLVEVVLRRLRPVVLLEQDVALRGSYFRLSLGLFFMVDVTMVDITLWRSALRLCRRLRLCLCLCLRLRLQVWLTL